MSRIPLPRSIKYFVFLIALILPCFAKEANVRGRIQFAYDDTRWQQLPTSVAGADIVQLAGDDGRFTALVMPEKAIAGGMSSAESRRLYFEKLAKTNTKTEDIRSVNIAGKAGHEFVGKREAGGVEYWMRIVLVVDAGDVFVLMASAQNKDPMSASSVMSIWQSITFPKHSGVK